MEAAAHTLNLSSAIPPDFIRKLLTDAATQATEGLRVGFVQALPTLMQFAPLFAKLLVILSIIAIFEAFWGNWEMLGSLLNRIFRIGFLVTIVWTFGFGVFFSDYFEIILAVLGAVSYWLVGHVTRKFPRRAFS